jgi:ribose transport system substrate-binding protein
MSNPFFTTLSDAAKAEAKALGPNVDLTVLGSTTLEEQVKALDDQISAKVDVIGFDPFDAKAVIPTVQQANAAGIKVMTVDSSAAGGTIDTYIGTDNVEGGTLAGEWLAQAMGGQGKLAIIEGDAGDSTNNDRLQGFHSVIDKTSIQVVSTLPAGWARDKGLSVMTDILTANPDLNAVFALNDEMALGAVQAIKAAGKTNQIIVVGYNGALEAIKAAYTGDMSADVVQYPEAMGKLFVDWAVRDMNGQKPPAIIRPEVNVVDSTLLAKVKLAVGQ